MVKLNNVIFAVIAVITSFISASAVTDEKHCAPRACCGCPNGKPFVKALMNVFLDKIAADERSDAFKLVAVGSAIMDSSDSSSCSLDNETVPDYFNEYFPAGSYFINTDFDYVMHHDGTIEAKFLAVVTKTNRVTKAYEMSYVWSVDAQCNWHISAIYGKDTACRIQDC